MNPEYNTSQSLDPSVKNKRLLIIAGILFGLIIVVVSIFSLLLSAHYPDYSLTKTPLNHDRNFSQIVGSDIYSYDGLAFSKLNIQTGGITILNKGLKLPVPKEVYWAGSRGALINFDHSFALTKVEEQLRGTDAEFDPTLSASMTWYLNFRDGSLHKVADLPVVPGQAIFSETDHGFYYIPDLSDEGSDAFTGNVAPLHFYDTTAHLDKTVSNNLDIVDVNHLSPCSDTAYKLCVIGRDADDARTTDLYGITANGQKTVILKSSGRLVPTNAANLFITTDQPASTASQVDEDSTYTSAPAQLRDLKGKSISSLSFDLAGDSIIPYIFSPTSFNILNSQQSSSSASTYQSGAKTSFGVLQTKNIPLKYRDGGDFANALRETASYGDNGTILATNSEGGQLLFASKNTSIQVPSVDTKTTKNIVDTCVKTYASSSEYFDDTILYKIYFKGNADFAKNIAAFSDCIIKANSKVLISNNFYFGAIDPVNGRITTD